MFTIEDAKRVQRDLHLGDVHVAYTHPEKGFVMAHTDVERSNKETVPLDRCILHQVMSLGPPMFPVPPDEGWYQITWSEDIDLLRRVPVWVIEGLAL